MSDENNLQIAIELARSGERDRAYDLFVDHVRTDPYNFQAWLWLSELASTFEEQTAALERAQALCPPDAFGQRDMQPHLNLLLGAIPLPAPAEVETSAQQQVITAATPSEKPALSEAFLQAENLEKAGAYNPAVRLYQTIIAQSQAPAERFEANRRITNIRQRQAADQAQPTLNLLLVMVGPVLLFGLMIFLLSALNLFHSPLLAIPGAAIVLAGSCLVSVTGMRPAHPKWIALFGAPGAGSEPQIHRGLRLAGWFCILAPFPIYLLFCMI